MEMNVILNILLSLLSATAFAHDDYLVVANEAKNQAPQQIAIYKGEAERANIAAKNVVQTYQGDADFAKKQVNNVLLQQRELSTNIGSNSKRTSSILIFVSFSMPRQSLEAYLRDAKKVGASVVVRGLIDNSFQKTYQRIAALVKASGGDGVELNPLWFRRFGIKAVPAVVVIPKGSPCFNNDVCHKKKDFDVMMGDIPLSAALKMIRDKGQLTSDIADAALITLQSSSYA